MGIAHLTGPAQDTSRRDAARGIFLDALPACLATFYIAWSVPFRVAFLPSFRTLAPAYAPWWCLDIARGRVARARRVDAAAGGSRRRRTAASKRPPTIREEELAA